MEKISAALITFNEERNIEDALHSVAWADEIVVVDAGSRDATREICRRHTDRIFHREWTGFVDQKRFAVEQHRTSGSSRSTRRARESGAAGRNPGAAASRVRLPGLPDPASFFFMGRWIHHGDWYPDHQLRLFDRRRGRWQGGRVHESVKTDAPPGLLRGRSTTTRTEGSRTTSSASTPTRAGCRRLPASRKVSSGAGMFGNPAATFVKAYCSSAASWTEPRA